MHRNISIAICLNCLLIGGLTAGASETVFTATLSSDNVITGGVTGTPSTATGMATFVLTQVPGDPLATTLSYFIQLQGIDLDGNQTPDPLDNVTAVHLHDSRFCSPAAPMCQPGDTSMTEHVLNIYGAPRLDDADIHVDAAAGTISGLWDVSDTNLAFPPTVSIAEAETLDILFGGHMFLNIHTLEVPSTAIGGFLRQVPEPGMGWLASWALVTTFLRRRRMGPNPA